MKIAKNLNGRKLYIVLLIVMMTLAISSFFLASAMVYNPGNEKGLHRIDPFSVETQSDGSTQYLFTFSKLTPTTRSLLFYTNHQEVHVYMDDILIYANTKADSIFGHTTGAVWNQIAMPERSGNVKVVVTPVYPSVIQKTCEFYQGNGVAMGYAILKDSFPSILMCIGIIIIGVCMLCFWGFFGMSRRWMTDVLYLGILVCFMGIWSLGETQGFIYAVQNRVAASYLAYTCLMAIGSMFVMFVHRFMHLQDQFWYHILLVYGFVEIVICELLQFLNIRDMKQTVILTHIMIVASVIYMFYGICINLYQHCYVRRSIVNLIGFAGILVTMSLDMYSYYDNRVNANQTGKFGILIYILLVGIETLRETRQHIDEEKQIEIYREMAMKDILTGCHNRNAYDESLERGMELKKSQVIMFDLNNLKFCNDTYGHQCGDKYLCDSAAIIRNVYGRYGNVYRIGGDEFCVITQGLSMKRLQDLQVRLTLAEREYNQRRPEVAIEIACGYASYDENCDKTIEDIRLRADARMYENKKELKGKSDRIRRVL